VNPKRLGVVKPEIRVLGIDDGRFIPHSKSQVHLVGVVFRGGYWLEGVMSTTVTVDGMDSTERISKMVTSSSHYKQLRVIMLNGVTFGGFNIVDIQKLNRHTGLPVIVVTQKKPCMSEVQVALRNLSNSEARWQTILNAGELYIMDAARGKKQLFVEIAGISKELAQKIISLTSTRSNLPEALRVAHLVASGIMCLE
jgi:endonuclease V-like protein UPF0215 family